MSLQWAYGITTVGDNSGIQNANHRFGLTLPRTVKSLQRGGFDSPSFFIDGECSDIRMTLVKDYDYTIRTPNVGVSGNWLLSLCDLYHRNKKADRFVIFQDDVIVYHHLFNYLNYIPYPERGYCNLYTYDSNIVVLQQNTGSPPSIGFFKSRITSEGIQAGKGALALMFNREAVIALLTSRHIWKRQRETNIDGGIVQAMNEQGYSEYVHYPSLVDHIGEVSTIRRGTLGRVKTFRGESFSALSLLETN